MLYLYMEPKKGGEVFSVLIVQSLDLQVKHSQLTLTQLNSLLRGAPGPSNDPVPTPRPPLAAHCSHSPLQHNIGIHLSHVCLRVSLQEIWSQRRNVVRD